MRKSEAERAAFTLLVLWIVVLQFAPADALDPWGVFIPRKFGILVLILATLEFSGYLLTRLIGERRGLLILGFLGGFVSSTATLVSAAKGAKTHPEKSSAYLRLAFAAQAAALLEMLIILGASSRPLFKGLLIPIIGGFITGCILLFSFRVKNEINPPTSEMRLRSPLRWSEIARLAIFLSAILAFVSGAKLWLGDRATYGIAFLTGLFELHGLTLATANFHDEGLLTLDVANRGLLLAILASFIAKIFISWSIERGSFARKLTVLFLPMGGAIGFLAWFVLGGF